MLVARYPQLDAGVGRSYAGALFSRALLASTSYQTVLTPVGIFDGASRMIVPHRVGNYPLLITVTNTVDEILADWRRQSFAIASATGSAILLVLLAGFLIRRQIVLREKMAQSVLDRQQADSARIAAEDASRSKSAFLANMSHELRTPLNAIIGFSELTRDAAFGPVNDRYREYAQDINAAGQHLLEVISDLLDMARMEAGKFQLQEMEFDLAELADEAHRLVLRDADKAGITLTNDIPRDLPMLIADRLRLKQILLNLLSNALKFTHQGGSIQQSATVAMDGALVISVSDTGIGMSAAEKEKALQPFEQIDNSMHRQADGVGLGLPLTKALIELHGGRLEIETMPGVGTIARIFLPAARLVQTMKSTRLDSSRM
jgi:two-component system, cell cycle sensor histidine kinase PleC